MHRKNVLSLFSLCISLLIAKKSEAQSITSAMVKQADSLYVAGMKVGILPAEEIFLRLKTSIPGLQEEKKYESQANFTGKILYRNADFYLRKPAAEALARVLATLKKRQLGLKIWDAYRPWNVSVLMWKAVPDERYAAHPRKGSGHNRGISVDLTLTDLHTGTELPMPTGFDNFSDTAHYEFIQLPAAVLENRLLLRRAMEAEGFRALETEWWHFTYTGSGRSYPVQNLSFRKLRQLEKLSASK